MSDFIRSLIKWILVIILAVLVIILIIKLVRGGTDAAKNQKKDTSTPVVHTIRDEDETNTSTSKEEKEKNNNSQSTLIISSQDTASTRGLSVLFGILIIGSTTFFIYKNRESE